MTPMSRQTRAPGRRPGLDTTLVVLVAAIPRIWHLVAFSRLPWFRALQMDPLYHARWARRLLDSGWHDPGPFFRAPLYPYLLAALEGATGDLLWSARIFQLVLGVATAALVHRIGLRLLPRSHALAAGILAALLWAPIYFETQLLLEPLVAFLTTLLLFLMIRSWGTEPSPGRLVLWGLVGGIGCATRPNLLLFLPALPVFAALSPAPVGQSRPGWRLGPRFSRILRASAFCLAGFLVPVLPIWIHNAREGDPATVLAWQGGINFYLGNNPRATGWAAVAPGMRTDWKGGYEDAVRLAQEGSGSAVPLRPSQVSDYWTRQGIRFWREDPAGALRLLGRKILFFWGGTEIKNNEDPGFFRHTMISLRWLPVSFGLLAPPALLGLFLALRRDPRWRLLSGFVLIWAASVVLFFVCARYRVPVAPLLPLFALLFLGEVRGWIKRRRWGNAGAGAGLLLLLYPVVYSDPAGIRGGGFFQSYCNLGDARAELGDWRGAEDAYRVSIDRNPKFPGSYNNLSHALEAQGRWEQAEEVCRRGLREVPGAPQLRKNLALILESEGKLDEASELARGLIEEYPQAWDSCIFLGRVQEAQKKDAEALASYRRALSIMPASVEARLRAARLETAAGDTAAALETIEAGLRFEPGNGDLRRVQGFLRAAMRLGN